ncbi:MAG: hypothetical protein AB1571_01300 [Nanoarchaeota archaeon]
MKSLVFDTSSIISIATNELIPVLKLLKEKFNGDFLISSYVKREIIDYPLTTKKFKLEAILIMDCLNNNYLKLNDDPAVAKKAIELLETANTIFKTHLDYIKILDLAEVEALVLAASKNSDAYVVDERTMRLLIENPDQLQRLLETKLHTKITMDRENLAKFIKETGNVKIIRSTELMVIAYELGLFNSYISKTGTIDKKLRSPLLEGLLWGLKLHGCSISEEEINEVMKFEKP